MTKHEPSEDTMAHPLTAEDRDTAEIILATHAAMLRVGDRAPLIDAIASAIAAARAVGEYAKLGGDQHG